MRSAERNDFAICKLHFLMEIHDKKYYNNVVQKRSDTKLIYF